MRGLIFCIVVIFLAQKLNGMQSPRISVNPNTMESNSIITVQFQNNLFEIPQNGYVDVTIPAQASITIGALVCQEQIYTRTVTCEGRTANLLRILVTDAQGIAKNFVFEVAIQGFKNPATTDTTDPFSIEVRNAAHALIDSSVGLDDTNLKITANPGGFTAASIKTTTSTVVGQHAPGLVAFTAEHQIPQNGQVKIIFPKWNPTAAANQRLSFISNTASFTCTSVANIENTLNCAYDTATDTLTVTNGFALAAAPGGTAISFQIANMRNPRTTAGITSGITIQTLTQAGSILDQSTAITFTGVDTPTAISNPETQNVDTTLVDQSGTFYLTFYVPVYVDAGCQVIIVFPPQIEIAESSIAEVKGAGIFKNSVTDFELNAPSSNQVTLRDACNTVSTQGQSSLIFETVRNPRTTTQSSTFQIFLNAGTTANIAQITTGMTFTASKGTIDSITITPDSTLVSSSNGYTFTLSPQTRLLPDSQIRILFPANEFQLTSGTCPTLVNLGGGISDNALTCVIDAVAGTLTLKNPFASQYQQQPNVTPTFKFPIGTSGGTISNPPTTATMSSLTFQTRVPAATGASLVDQNTYTPAFTLTVNSIASAQVVPTNTQTNALTTYTLTLESSGVYPAGTTFEVTFPTDITVTNLSTLSSSCSNVQNFLSATCSAVTSGGTTKVTITSAWSSSQPAGTTFSILFGGNVIKNPRTTATTGEFTITVSTPQGAIEQTTPGNGPTVTMASVPDFTSASVTKSDSHNSQINSYTFKMRTPIQLLDNDVVKLQPPSQIASPTATTPVCTGTLNLESGLLCTKSGESVLVTLNFPTSQSNVLAAGEQLEFIIQGYRNPPSTATSDSFILTARQGNGDILAYSPNDLKITTSAPASITSANVALTTSSSVASESAIYTFKFNSVGQIPAGGMVRLVYPSTITISTLPNCKGDGSPLPLSVACNVDTNNRFITITNGFSTAYEPGQITAIIDSITNPATASTTESFQIFTYGDQAASILIDSALTGMLPSVACDFPCLTCNTGVSTSTCTACIASTNLYLQGNICVASCGDGYITNPDTSVKTCLACDQSCKTCQSSITQCTSCDAGKGLLNNACLDNCPAGYFMNPNTNTCDACVSPCFTCSDLNTCTSCLQTQNLKYLHIGGVCVDTCPAGYLAIGSNCNACTAPCAECQIALTTCTSCTPGNFLYQKGCVANCPAGITVQINNVCQSCNTNCATCSGAIDNCLTCPTNRVLKNGACTTSCDAGTQLNINGICTPCSLTCAKCETSVTNCIQCSSNEFLHNSACLTQCPTGYLGTNGACVPGTVVCPANFELGSDGITCVLSCASGYQANSAGTGCIIICTLPEVVSSDGTSCYTPSTSITLYYFPFLVTTFVVFFFPFSAWCINRKSLFLSNTIVLWSFIETGAFAVQGYLSYRYEATYLFYVTAGVCGALFLCNVIFGLLYCGLTNTDVQFREWKRQRRSFKCMAGCFVTLATVLNFRAMRFFYSRFWNFPQFSARFHQMRRVFVNPLLCLTTFSFVCISFPIIIIDIFAYVNYFNWGTSQLPIIMIETLVIEVLLLIFQLFEIWSSRKIQDLVQDTLSEKEYEPIKPGSFHRLRGEENSFSSFLNLHEKEEKKEASTDAVESLVWRSRSDKKMFNETDSLFRKNKNKIAPPKPLLSAEVFEKEELLKRSKSHQDLRQGVDEIKSDDESVNSDEMERMSFPTTPKRFRELKEQQKAQEQEDRLAQEFDPILAPNNVYAERKPRIDNFFSLDGERHREAEERLYGFIPPKDISNAGTQTPKKKGGSTLHSLRQGLLRSSSSELEIINEAGNQSEASSDHLPKLDERDNGNAEILPIPLFELYSQEQLYELEQKAKARREKTPKLYKAKKMQFDRSSSSFHPESVQNSHTVARAGMTRMSSAKSFDQQSDPLMQFQSHSRLRIDSPPPQQFSVGSQSKPPSPPPETMDEEEFFEPKPNKHLYRPLTVEEIEVNQHPAIPGQPHLFMDVKQMKGVFHQDVRGTNIITKNRKGEMVDKFGRRVNALGYLEDKNGNLLVADNFAQDSGYRGGTTSYAPNCFGEFEMNEDDELIIERNNEGMQVDKWGRPVNAQGYLIDARTGSIMTAEGEILALKGDLGMSYEGPFSDVRVEPPSQAVVIHEGDQEIKPPMVKQDSQGNLFDIRGRRINKKGFVIDCFGNILNEQNQISFLKDDLESDQQFPELLDIAEPDFDTEGEEEIPTLQIIDTSDEEQKILNQVDGSAPTKAKDSFTSSRNQLHQKSSAELLLGGGPSTTTFMKEDTLRQSKNSVTQMLERELSKIKSQSNDLLPDIPQFHSQSRKVLETSKEVGSSYASQMDESPSKYNSQNAKASGSEMGISSEAKTNAKQTKPGQATSQNQQTYDSKQTTTAFGPSTQKHTSHFMEGNPRQTMPGRIMKQDREHSIHQKFRDTKGQSKNTPMASEAEQLAQLRGFSGRTPHCSDQEEFNSSETEYQGQYDTRKGAGGRQIRGGGPKKLQKEQRRTFYHQRSNRVMPGVQQFPGRPPINRILKKDTSKRRGLNSTYNSRTSLVKASDTVSRLGNTSNRISRTHLGGGSFMAKLDGHHSSRKLLQRKETKGLLPPGGNLVLDDNALEPTTPNTKNHLKEVQMKQQRIMQIREKFARDGSLQKLYDPSDPESSSQNGGAAILKPEQNRGEADYYQAGISPLRAAGGGVLRGNRDPRKFQPVLRHQRAVSTLHNGERLKGLENIYLSKLARPEMLNYADPLDTTHQRSQSTLKPGMHRQSTQRIVGLPAGLRSKASRSTLHGAGRMMGFGALPPARKMAEYVESFAHSQYKGGSEDAMGAATNLTPSPVKQEKQRNEREQMIKGGHQQSGARLKPPFKNKDQFEKLMNESLRNFGLGNTHQDNRHPGPSSNMSARYGGPPQSVHRETMKSEMPQNLSPGLITSRPDLYTLTQGVDGSGGGGGQSQIHNWVKQ